MSIRQTNTIWSIIVVILIAVITYMAIDRKDNNREYNKQANQNSELITKQNNVVDNEARTEPVEPENTENWKTYSNAEYGFEFKYPADGVIDSERIRIDNLPNYQMETFPEGKFLLELGIDNQKLACQTQMKNPEEFMIGDLVAYRGVALDGPWSSYSFSMCIWKDGNRFQMFVTDGFKEGDIAYKIMDSFRFTSPESSVSLKTYTNPVYKYSFDYPSQYELRADSTRGQYLVDQTSTSVVFAEDEDDNLSFLDFMFKRVKLLCDADGVGASITCPKYAKNPVAFKTSSGLNAYTLVFVEETTKTEAGKNPIVTKRNKTVYAVDLGVGPALAGGTTRIILAVSPINLDAAKDLTLSVKKTN